MDKEQQKCSFIIYFSYVPSGAGISWHVLQLQEHSWPTQLGSLSDLETETFSVTKLYIAITMEDSFLNGTHYTEFLQTVLVS
jgi:hypothetical protein